MNAVDFFSASRVLIVAGKGGVGKTTVGATVGIAAARAGLRTHIVELEGRSNLGIPFGVETLTHRPSTLIEPTKSTGRLRGSRLTPDQALGDYLVDHGLRIGGRLAKFSAIEIVTTTAPGIRDLLTLGKIRSLEEGDEDETGDKDEQQDGKTEDSFGSYEITRWSLPPLRYSSRDPTTRK